MQILGSKAGSAGRAKASRDRDCDMDSDGERESYVRRRGEEVLEEEKEEEGQLTDPEIGEEGMASGDAGAETGSKVRVKGPLESESDEEVTLKTGSKGKAGLSVRSEEPLESSSDEEVTLSREVMEYGETGGRSDTSRNVTRKFPLAAYGDTGRARERERKPGRVGRRPTPLVRVYYRKPYREYRRYIQEQSEEDKEILRQQEKEKEKEKQELDPKEGPSGRQGLKDLCKSVLLDRPDSD